MGIPGSSAAGGQGHADLLFRPTREIWEVKTASQLVNRQPALDQLARYVTHYPRDHQGARTQSTSPYPPGQLHVDPFGNPGMLWYYSRPVPRPVP